MHTFAVAISGCRSRIHFGWNWALVVFGLNVSGFKMGVTGFVVRWRVSDLWSGGSYGPEASVLTCGIIVAFDRAALSSASPAARQLKEGLYVPYPPDDLFRR